jgi:hypothetical protein
VANLTIVMNLSCTGSSDRADGTKEQHIVGTSISVNGVANTSTSLVGTVVSDALLFQTDFSDQVTITG